MAPLLLALETATDTCSVALFQGPDLIACSETHQPRLHNRLLAHLTHELLRSLDLQPADLGAVGLSAGPGSYTGLRVGASFAQGLCFALGCPLIAVPSTEVLAAAALDVLPHPEATLLPLIDARRMEVYTAPYSPSLETLGPIEARIVDETTADALAGTGRPLVALGDGATKCALLWKNRPQTWIFDRLRNSAAAMGRSLDRRYAAGNFSPAAGFEPLYLKPVHTRPGRDPLGSIAQTSGSR